MSMPFLPQLLLDLKEGKYEAVEFGEPHDPTGVMAGIRIKYIQTAGGMQFRICTLSRGMESGGLYEPTATSTGRIAQEMQDRYTRPHPNPQIQKFLSTKPKRELSWYGIEAMPIPLQKPPVPPLFKDEVIIELKLPGV